jgi:hypothetical protein
VGFLAKSETNRSFRAECCIRRRLSVRPWHQSRPALRRGARPGLLDHHAGHHERRLDRGHDLLARINNSSRSWKREITSTKATSAKAASAATGTTGTSTKSASGTAARSSATSSGSKSHFVEKVICTGEKGLIGWFGAREVGDKASECSPRKIWSWRRKNHFSGCHTQHPNRHCTQNLCGFRRRLLTSAPTPIHLNFSADGTRPTWFGTAPTPLTRPSLPARAAPTSASRSRTRARRRRPSTAGSSSAPYSSWRMSRSTRRLCR